MKLKTLLFFFLIASNFAFGQSNQFKIKRHTFIIKNKKVNNEWNTKDDVREVFLNKKHVLTYYAYKSEGGDCNNVFWDKEWLKVKNNTIIITTHHLQKRLDPITEWEQKTFSITKNGEVKQTKHLYKKYGNIKWKQSEEWYKK